MNDLDHLASVGDAVDLGLGDDGFCIRTQAAGLGFRRGDPAVLEKAPRQVGQNQPLVRRTSAEAGTLCWGRHFFVSKFSSEIGQF